jgi:hypothetical protein
MALVLVACSVAAASLCYLLYRQDRVGLRVVAEQITAESSPPAQKVLTLLHWVNEHGTSARNDAYFVFRRMRATPIQVLNAGGDCADKSRLLTALLREVGIPATMAMSYHPQSGRPAHTFVEARIGEQAYMAVDPAYDLYFPKPDSISHRMETGVPEAYYDLLDLRCDAGILSRRVDHLREGSSYAPEVQDYYLRPSVEYVTASSINWNKNTLTRLLHFGLQSVYGDAVYRFPRPLVSEEPKLFVAILCLIPGGISLLALGCVERAGRRNARRAFSHRDHEVSTIAGTQDSGHGMPGKPSGSLEWDGSAGYAT